MGLVQKVRNIGKASKLITNTVSRAGTNGNIARITLPLREYVSEKGSSDQTVNENLVNSCNSMATMLPLLGWAYADLIGKELTYQDIRAQALIGALARVQDDLVDWLGIDDNRLDLLYESPHDYKPNYQIEKLAKRLWTDLCEEIPEEKFPAYHRTLRSLHECQKKSKHQSEMSDTELWNITLQKGSLAALAFMHAVRPEMEEHHQDHKAIRTLGWFQIIDDVADVEKDRKEGIKTVAQIEEPAALRGKLLESRERSRYAFSKLAYDTGRKEAMDFALYFTSLFPLTRLSHGRIKKRTMIRQVMNYTPYRS